VEGDRVNHVLWCGIPGAHLSIEPEIHSSQRAKAATLELAAESVHAPPASVTSMKAFDGCFRGSDTDSLATSFAAFYSFVISPGVPMEQKEMPAKCFSGPRHS
jgi:hypothetical protein